MGSTRTRSPTSCSRDSIFNPFTNRTVRDRIVQFYYKNDGADHYHTIFWQVLNNDGSVFATNDPDQTLGTPHLFGSMVIGTSRGVQSFQTADIRNRGGGLAPQWQAIPEAINFWDLGSLDGKPYPGGGAMAVYLPVSVLERLTPAQPTCKGPRTRSLPLRCPLFTFAFRCRAGALDPHSGHSRSGWNEVWRVAAGGAAEGLRADLGWAKRESAWQVRSASWRRCAAGRRQAGGVRRARRARRAAVGSAARGGDRGEAGQRFPKRRPGVNASRPTSFILCFQVHTRS